jgi:hypothetical protein
MPKLSLSLMALAVGVSLTAQSPITTLYSGSASLGSPSVVFFDVTLNLPLQFLQVDVNTNSTAGTAGSISVYWTPNTRVGNETNVAAWTLGSTAPVVAAGSNLPSIGVLATPFTLPPGNYGIGIQYNGINSYYTGAGGQTFSTVEMTILPNAGSSNGALGTAICCQPRTWNGSLHYANAGSGTVATRTNYGAGCYDRRSSFYELFTANTFDLSNSSIQMVPNGSGYVVLGGSTSFFTPTSAALPLTDDSVSAPQTMPFTFSFPGGSTTQLWISSNGFVWLAASTANGCCNGFATGVGGLLADLPRLCPMWHDLNPGAGGTVHFDVDPNNTAVYVTYLNVPEFGQPTALNTMQVMIDQSGLVEFRYQTCASIGHTTLTGFSPGGNALDPGSADLSTVNTSPILTAPDTTSLALAASARPVAGTTINLVTSNAPATSVLGVTFLAFAQVNPGLELSIVGMPGCFQNVALQASSVMGVASGTGSLAVALPSGSSLNGIHVYCQSAVFAPGQNTLGVLSSNGVDLLLGDL